MESEMPKYVKTEEPILGIKREVEWRVARRYNRMYKGQLMTRLTKEDDIVYLANWDGELIGWVRLIIPKSYA